MRIYNILLISNIISADRENKLHYQSLLGLGNNQQI